MMVFSNGSRSTVWESQGASQGRCGVSTAYKIKRNCSLFPVRTHFPRLGKFQRAVAPLRHPTGDRVL